MIKTPTKTSRVEAHTMVVPPKKWTQKIINTLNFKETHSLPIYTLQRLQSSLIEKFNNSKKRHTTEIIPIPCDGQELYSEMIIIASLKNIWLQDVCADAIDFYIM